MHREVTMGLFNKLFGKKGNGSTARQDITLPKTDPPKKMKQPQIIEPPQKSGIIAINNKNGGFDLYEELLNHAKEQMYKSLREPETNREFEIIKKYFSEPIQLERSYYDECSREIVFVFSSANVKPLLEDPEFSYITDDSYKECGVDVILMDVTYELYNVFLKNTSLYIKNYTQVGLWLEERKHSEILDKANNPDNIAISSNKVFIDAANIYNTLVNQIPFEELIQERNEQRANMLPDENNKVQFLPN